MNKNFDQIIQALLSKYREASKKSKYATVGVVSTSVLFFSLLGFRSIRPSIRLLPGPVQTQTSSSSNMEERDLDTQETPFVFVEEHKNDDEKNQKKEDQSIKETRLVTTDQPPRSSFLRWKYLAIPVKYIGIPVVGGLTVKYVPEALTYLLETNFDLTPQQSNRVKSELRNILNFTVQFVIFHYLKPPTRGSFPRASETQEWIPHIPQGQGSFAFETAFETEEWIPRLPQEGPGPEVETQPSLSLEQEGPGPEVETQPSLSLEQEGPGPEVETQPSLSLEQEGPGPEFPVETQPSLSLEQEGPGPEVETQPSLSLEEIDKAKEIARELATSAKKAVASGYGLGYALDSGYGLVPEETGPIENSSTSSGTEGKRLQQDEKRTEPSSSRKKKQSLPQGALAEAEVSPKLLKRVITSEEERLALLRVKVAQAEVRRLAKTGGWRAEYAADALLVRENELKKIRDKSSREGPRLEQENSAVSKVQEETRSNLERVESSGAKIRDKSSREGPRLEQENSAVSKVQEETRSNLERVESSGAARVINRRESTRGGRGRNRRESTRVGVSAKYLKIFKSTRSN